MNNRMNHNHSVLFTVNFTEFLHDKEAIQFYRTNQHDYKYNYTKYKLKRFYAVSRLLDVKNSMKAIPTRCAGILFLEEVSSVLAVFPLVTHIEFHAQFNEAMDHFPVTSNITYFKFGKTFNQTLEH